MADKTLRLTMPQWQGGNEPAYYFGAQVLEFLAPAANGPAETVPVDDPSQGAKLENESGIVGRAAVVRQTRDARKLIDRHAPDRIVVLGGDCLVDLAPIAYLSEKHRERLGVLWIDSHPDVIGPKYFAHSHAHVLGALLGEGDPDFDAQVAVKVDPRRVIYAGLDAWSEPEDEIIKRLGLRNVTSDEIAMTSKPVLDWIKAEGITHLAIHLDLDVLDPALFSPLLFNNPSAPPDAWAGVPRGKLRLEHVTRLLNDVDKACHIAGLAIAEFLPWDMMRLRDAMRDMPLLKG